MSGGGEAFLFATPFIIWGLAPFALALFGLRGRRVARDARWAWSPQVDSGWPSTAIFVLRHGNPPRRAWRFCSSPFGNSWAAGQCYC